MQDLGHVVPLFEVKSESRGSIVWHVALILILLSCAA